MANTKIRLGIPMGFLRFGLEAVMAEGFIGREELEIFEPAGEKETPALIMAGNVDMGRISSIEAIKANLRGDPIRVVAGFDNEMVHVIVGGKGIDSPGGLKGGKAGVNGFGDYTDQYMRAALAYLGLKPDGDVAVVAAGKSAERRRQLAEGMVQATIVSRVQGLRLKDKGFPWLVQMADVFPHYVSKVIVAGERTIKDKPEALAKVLAAMIKGCRYLDRPENEAAVGRIAAALNLKDPALAMSQIQVRRSRNPIDDGAVTGEGFAVVLAEAGKKGIIAADYHHEALFEFGPLRKAQQMLGIEAS